MSLTVRERWAVVVAAVLLGLLGLQLQSAYRRHAREAELREALRRFAMAQESFRYDRKVYGVDPGEFATWGYQPASDQRIQIVEATVVGWSAIAEHPPSGTRCYVFVRDAAPVGPALEAGVIECL